MRAFWCFILLSVAALLTDVFTPIQPVAAQQPPINQLLIGNMNLTGGFWDVLNLQGITPAHRSELRLFPKSGTTTDQFDPVGGEVTISGDDLNNLDSDGDYNVLAVYAYNQEFRMQSQVGGKRQPYPIKFDSMGGFINFTLNSDGSLGIGKGISNTEGAGGFAHTRIRSCIAPVCQDQVTWQTNFVDTNYTATCTLGGATGSVSWLRKEVGFLVINVIHGPGSTGGEVDCIGVHD